MILRTLEQTLKKYLFRKKTIILFGARQVGKSTLLKLITTPYQEQLIIFNGDEPDTRALFDQAGSVKLRSMIGKKSVVIIDEAQKIPDIGIVMKLIHDNFQGVQLIVSGSSSFDLSAKVQEPMTGRKLEFGLFPLTFMELVNHHGLLHEKRNLENRMIFGSYPDIVTHPEDAEIFLKSLVSSYLYKDVLVLEQIKKPVLVDKLVRALALQVGSEVSYNELANLLRADHLTVEKYVDILEKAYIIFRLPSYSRNVRNEIRKGRKIYFWDNGVMNTITGDFLPLTKRKDVGALWENYIISEKMKKNAYEGNDSRTFFWRTTHQQEIDFIEESPSGLSAYEIKWKFKLSARMPLTFSRAYPEATCKYIHPGNYDEILNAPGKK